MNPEQSRPVPLEPPSSRGRARAYPWWGLAAGAAAGVFLGHPVSMMVQNIQDALSGQQPFAPGQALIHSFHLYMWPMMLLYGLTLGLFGAILGYIFRRLTEQRLLVELLHQEFELQVATLRHHYKNLAIGIQGFSGRIRRKAAKLEECLAGCAQCERSAGQDVHEDVADLLRNADILQDTAARLSARLGQELSFLKALTSETQATQPADLHPLLVAAVGDLLALRFRDKTIRVEINSRPWNESQGSLVFPFEPYTMEVVLQNLLSNAMKYGDHLHIATAQEGSRVIVSIQDNGPGIEVEELRRQLEAPPSQAEADSTHLGLKVTLYLLEKCGGELKVWSAPGAGATFVLEFTRP